MNEHGLMHENKVWNEKKIQFYIKSKLFSWHFYNIRNIVQFYTNFYSGSYNS